MPIFKVKLPFYPPCEVKYGLQNRVSTMTSIVSYLKDGKLLEGKDKARKLRVRSDRYVLKDEAL